jgi:hypothetical protein
VEPAHGVSEQVGLVDRLRRADVAQLGWAVGGDDEHRNGGQVGLDDRGVEVGRRRAARAQQHGRRPGQSEAEGDERRRPLVVDDVDSHLRPLGESQRHRRVPATRRHHGVPHPSLRPLVDEGRTERRLRGLLAHE